MRTAIKPHSEARERPLDAARALFFDQGRRREDAAAALRRPAGDPLGTA